MTAARIDEKLVPVLHTVLRRNPGEPELHQAVREVLETLGPVVAKHPDYIEGKLLERICEPEPYPRRLPAATRCSARPPSRRSSPPAARPA